MKKWSAVKRCQKQPRQFFTQKQHRSWALFVPWCTRGGEEIGDEAQASAQQTPSHSAQTATESGMARSQASRGLIFLWHQPLLCSRRKGWYCFPAHHSPTTSVPGRPTGQLGQHPSRRTCRSSCFEGRCSFLKGTFFLPLACGQLQALKPGSWWTLWFYLSWQICRYYSESLRCWIFV